MLRVHDSPSDLWSAPIGAWLGVPVRLHATLVGLLVLAIGAAVNAASFHLGLAITLFVASLALHEAAHALAAWRLGGGIEGVVLSPIGGLQSPRAPVDAESRVFVAMAGPFANLAVVVLGVVCLAAWEQPAPPDLFLPRLDASMTPAIGDLSAATQDPVVTLAQIAIWVNWPLFVLNLLPAFPFDGGEAARSRLAPRIGSATAAEIVGRCGLLLGVLMVVLAPLAIESVGAWPSPSTMAATLGLIICFGSQRDRLLARNGRLYGGTLAYPTDEAGYDLSDDEWSDETDDRVMVLEFGRHAKHHIPNAGPHADPASDFFSEQRLDEVLEKLHRDGMEGLSSDERLFLERASDSIRRRKS